MDDKVHRPQILLVDDEQFVLTTLKRLIRSRGDVHLAGSGREALEIVQSQPIDLIITDMRMPEMNGAELLAAINALNLPLNPARILLTAYSDLSLLEAAVNSGKIDCLMSKPWDNDKLLEAIDHELRHHYLDVENRNLTERLHTKNQKLTALNSRLQTYIQVVDQHVITSSTDLSGTIINVSQAFANISKYSKDELIGAPHSIVRHPKMPSRHFDNLWQKILQGMPWNGEILNRAKDGSFYWVSSVIEPDLDDDGVVVGFTSIQQDITDKKRVEQLSKVDQLTNLFNRRRLDEVIVSEQEKARRFGRTFSLILFDIDKFKFVNDNFGHQVGDQVLKGVADIARQSVRTIDTVGRWGGEEFLIVCPETDLGGAQVLAEKIRTRLSQHDFAEVGVITASFGVVEYRPGETEMALIKRVDDRLYAAKSQGRNCVVADL